jgi:hypothetical protein
MRLPMTLPREMRSQIGSEVRLAIVLDGVSEKWQMNVLPILARPTTASVEVDGYGAIDATAFVLSPEQARHLAIQIIELLGSTARG